MGRITTVCKLKLLTLDNILYYHHNIVYGVDHSDITCSWVTRKYVILYNSHTSMAWRTICSHNNNIISHKFEIIQDHK